MHDGAAFRGRRDAALLILGSLKAADYGAGSSSGAWGSGVEAFFKALSKFIRTEARLSRSARTLT